MIAKLVKATLLCGAMLFGAAASAAPIEFVPSSDTVGAEAMAGNNGWWMGRGLAFGVSSSQTLNSIGFMHDLSGIDVSFGIYEISKNSVTLSKLATVASGGATVTTLGRAWIDFALGGVVLETGKDYLLEFAFQGDANSNFFYDDGYQSWDQGAFIGLDGTLGPELLNTAVAAFRVDLADAAADVPEPGSLALLVIGVVALARRRR